MFTADVAEEDQDETTQDSSCMLTADVAVEDQDETTQDASCMLAHSQGTLFGWTLQFPQSV